MIKRVVFPLVVLFSTVVLISSGCSKPHASAPAEQAPEAKSSPAGNPADLFAAAEGYRGNGELVKAKEIYERILSDHPDFDKIDVVQQQMGDLNLTLINSKAMIEGKTVLHEVKSGDSLGKIAKQYGTTIELIKKSNGLTRDVIRLGDRLRIWTAPFNIFVDKSQNVLVLKTGDEILKTYSVSTGANNSTPVGEFTITTKIANPTWYKSGAVVAPNSPENALGTRWMGFDLKGYGIHGTIDPASIGHQATAGCVRMLNQEVEQLYDMIPAGTKVTITD